MANTLLLFPSRSNYLTYRYYFALSVAIILCLPLLFYLLIPTFVLRSNNVQHSFCVGTGMGKHLPRNNKVEVALLEGEVNFVNVIHVTWCQNKSFQFMNYVAIKSAIDILDPNIVMFHFFDQEPPVDKMQYNTWFEDLKKTVHNLIIRKEIEKIATCRNSPAISLVHLALGTEIYLDPTTIITSREYLLSEIHKASNVSLDCSELETLSLPTTFSPLPNCFSVKNNKNSFYPAAFFESADDPLSKHIRMVLFGQSAPLIAKPNPKSLVPLICHYIWLGGGSVGFLIYLSILSCLNVVRADAVLVHGDEEPKGDLWNELMVNYQGRLNYVYRPLQPSVFGRPVKKLSPMSDVLRLDILLKYGGIYTDWDSVWVKSLDVSIRSYDTSVAYDWPVVQPYPDTFNLGAMMSKPGAPFLHYLQASLREDFVDTIGQNLWCYICLKAYKVYERYPNTVHIDRHLQVISYQTYYHPTWIDGFKETLFTPAPDQFDWQRGDTYALHWTFPTPSELRSAKLAAKSNSLAASVARFILSVSNI